MQPAVQPNWLITEESSSIIATRDKHLLKLCRIYESPEFTLGWWYSWRNNVAYIPTCAFFRQSCSGQKVSFNNGHQEWILSIKCFKLRFSLEPLTYCEFNCSLNQSHLRWCYDATFFAFHPIQFFATAASSTKKPISTSANLVIYANFTHVNFAPTLKEPLRSDGASRQTVGATDEKKGLKFYHTEKNHRRPKLVVWSGSQYFFSGAICVRWSP